MSGPAVDQDTFITLLETARELRRQRRERLARLVRRGAGPARCVAASPESVDARAIRSLTGLSQSRFAELLGIELATLRNWEQGRRQPTGPARALLRAIRNNPIEVIRALSD
jgi:ribosome-binding protein aMBF1 (putative translation factor)